MRETDRACMRVIPEILYHTPRFTEEMRSLKVVH